MSGTLDHPHRSPIQRFTWATGAALLLILALGACLRFYQIGSASFWLDEFFSAEIAAGRGYWFQDMPHGTLIPAPIGTAVPDQNQNSASNVIDAMVRTNHPPLYFLVLHYWMQWFGNGDVAIRALSALASILAMIALFDAMDHWHGGSAALWACLIMALAGPQIKFAQEARGYTLLLALSLMAVAAIARIETRGPSRLRLLALTTFVLLMLLTHYLAFPLLVAMAIYVAVRLRGRQFRLCAAAIGCAVVLFLVAWGPYLYFQRADFRQELAWLHDFSATPKHDTWITFLQLPVNLFFHPSDHTGPILWLGAGLYLMPLLLIRRQPRLLMWWLLMTATIVTVALGDWLHDTRALTLPRYTLAATGAAYALVAAMASSHRIGRHVIPAVIALSCLLALQEAYVQWKADWRSMALYVAAHSQNDEPLVFYHAAGGDWTDGALYMGIRHYAPQLTGPVVFLAKPADDALEERFPSRRYAWIINPSGLDDSTLLPGCREISFANFTFLSNCDRVLLPPRSLASATATPAHGGF